jgi:hypothetical protein
MSLAHITRSRGEAVMGGEVEISRVKGRFLANGMAENTGL